MRCKPGQVVATDSLQGYVNPICCFAMLVIEGNTNFELERSQASLKTASAASPIGRMLLPVLVVPRRRALPDQSISDFFSPSISFRRQPVKARARVPKTACQCSHWRDARHFPSSR